MTTHEQAPKPEVIAGEEYNLIIDAVKVLEVMSPSDDLTTTNGHLEKIKRFGNQLAGTEGKDFLMGVFLSDIPGGLYDYPMLATRIMHAFTAQYVVNRCKPGRWVDPRVMGFTHMKGVAKQLEESGVFSLGQAYGVVLTGLESYSSGTAAKRFKADAPESLENETETEYFIESEQVYAGIIRSKLRPLKAREDAADIAKKALIVVGAAAGGAAVAKILGGRTYDS